MSGTIAITGGTGFVGRRLVAALQGRPVRLLLRDPSKAPPGVEVVRWEAGLRA